MSLAASWTIPKFMLMREGDPQEKVSSRNRRIRAALLCGLLLTSVLPIAARAQAPHPLTDADRRQIDSILQKMSIRQKLAFLGGTGFAIRAFPKLGLPAFEMSDGPYGLRSADGLPSTAYAAGIGLAASWDPGLAEKVGTALGRDARARGVHFLLGPGVNIYRSPRNGRNFEYFGEDPFLAARITVGYIDGVQGQGVSATVKHFAANNSEVLRGDADSIVDDRTLHEIYLPAFEAAVREAHVGAIMDGYNALDGQHATQNRYLNQVIARETWGFDGTIMSDWGATHDAVAAVNGGLDLEMPQGDFMNMANLIGVIRTGLVESKTIDDHVRHILSTAFEFNWLARPQRDESISLDDAADQSVALESARESIVLLKNEGNLLPLHRKDVRTVLVVGPNAYPGRAVGGGSAGVVPFHMIGPLEGIEEIGGSIRVLYDEGIRGLPELSRRTRFTTTKDGNGNGLSVEFFHRPDFSGAPYATKIVSHVDSVGRPNYNEMDTSSAPVTSVKRGPSRRFTGYFTSARNERFVVALQGGPEASGNRLYIDGRLIIDNWEQIRAFQPYEHLSLTGGKHKVVLEDTYTAEGARLQLAIVPERELVNESAIRMAVGADAVVVAAGFQSESECEGGDRTFGLPYGQDELIQAMAKANKNTIVAINSGGAVDAEAWLSSVPAVLQSWYPGEYGGIALAEILFGAVSPSGHLPISFERRAEDNPSFRYYYPSREGLKVRYEEGLFSGYRGFLRSKIKPLFPFGYGLSYTTFRFGRLGLVPYSGPDGTGVTVSFEITNTGQLAGAEVAQVYVGPLDPGTSEPARELKGFQRVQLAPGESKHISVHLNARAFSTYDVKQKRWVQRPGTYLIYVGDSVESLPLRATTLFDPTAAINRATRP